MPNWPTWSIAEKLEQISQNHNGRLSQYSTMWVLRQHIMALSHCQKGHFHLWPQKCIYHLCNCVSIYVIFLSCKGNKRFIAQFLWLLPAATKLWPRQYFYTCLSFCSQGGGSASVHAGIPHPPEQTHPSGADPPGADPPKQTPPPPEQTPPWEQTPPRADPLQSRHPPGSRLHHTIYERPVRILLECILVFCIC